MIVSGRTPRVSAVQKSRISRRSSASGTPDLFCQVVHAQSGRVRVQQVEYSRQPYQGLTCAGVFHRAPRAGRGVRRVVPAVRSIALGPNSTTRARKTRRLVTGTCTSSPCACPPTRRIVSCWKPGHSRVAVTGGSTCQVMGSRPGRWTSAGSCAEPGGDLQIHHPDDRETLDLLELRSPSGHDQSCPTIARTVDRPGAACRCTGTMTHRARTASRTRSRSTGSGLRATSTMPSSDAAASAACRAVRCSTVNSTRIRTSPGAAWQGVLAGDRRGSRSPSRRRVDHRGRASVRVCRLVRFVADPLQQVAAEHADAPGGSQCQRRRRAVSGKP